MSKKIQTIGIINSTVAAGCLVTTDPNYHIIIDNTTTQEILKPIPKGGRYSLTITAPIAERTQVKVIGIDDEVITADTRYAIRLGCHMRKYENVHEIIGTYAYTSPSALTGTASTDRYNVYNALATKINNHVNNFVAAYILYKVTFTTGTTSTGADGFASTPANNKVTYGATGTQAVSGVTMNVAYVASSDNTWGGATTGTIWVYNISAVGSLTTNAITFTSSDYYTGGSGQAETIVVTPTTASFTAGQGLAIVDDAYYFNPALVPSRQGASELFVTAGFLTAHEETVRTYQYLDGLASDFLLKLPTYGLYGRDEFIRGDVEQQRYDESKTFSLTVYSKWSIHAITDASIDALSGSATPLEKEYVFYMHNHETNPAGTAYYAALTTEASAFETTLETALGCTATHINY